MELNEIKDFADLTQFMSDEQNKLNEDCGVQQPSSTMVEYREKSIIKYVKLYDKPLYRAAKLELKIREAINTMPHSWLWKFWHSDLWRKVEYRLAQEKQREDENKKCSQPLQPDVTLPQLAEIVKPRALSQVSDTDA